jgi:hypothetical protein
MDPSRRTLRVIRLRSLRFGSALNGRLGTRRLAAWIVDWLIVSIYPAALVPLGLLLASRSFTLPSLAWNLVTFAGLIAPVTLWLAWWECTRAATPGKRLLHLRVTPGPQRGEPASLTGESNPDHIRQPVDRHERPSARKAMARNALKVALPWEVAHTGIFILTDEGAGGGRPRLRHGLYRGGVPHRALVCHLPLRRQPHSALRRRDRARRPGRADGPVARR